VFEIRLTINDCHQTALLHLNERGPKTSVETTSMRKQQEEHVKPRTLACSGHSIFSEVEPLGFRSPGSTPRGSSSFCTAKVTKTEASPATRKRLSSRISGRISAVAVPFSSSEPLVYLLA